MAKAIPAKEFKDAIKELNTVLKADKATPIKTVGVKKEDVVLEFTNIILDYIERDETQKLPDAAINFYNDYIANDDDGEDTGAETETEKKTSGAKSGKGAGKKKTSAPKKKPAAPKEKKPGIVELTIKAYMEDGILEKAALVETVGKNFPDRDISKTVSHVYGVLKHIKPYEK